jgi:DNA-binding transcriptional regulator YiaG
MPNLATLLKTEISRVARKEVRGETVSLKRASSTHRSEIAALKRRTQALEQQLRRLSRLTARPSPPEIDEPSRLRFSPKSLASQRRRLGLSAADCGLLIGASSQSVYNWEEGKARPRDRHLTAIAALRRLGKRQATAQLNALRQGD